MIDLKRNSKKQLVEATGMRVRQSSIYSPNQTDDFKVSRGKFSDYLTCKKCFYLDRVIGLDSPGMPGWTLNETTDILLKKEFDLCRKEKKPHRLFLENNLDFLIPFDHPDIDKWRDSLHHGLMHRYNNSNIILTGGVDDIWLDTRYNKLVIADYKSQANNKSLDSDSYLADIYHSSYKIQMDFYAYLLQCMNFELSELSYFLVCNADRNAEGFYSKMDFQEVLIPYKWNSSWIPNEISKMIDLMNQKVIPDGNLSCKNCAYAKQRAKLEK